MNLADALQLRHRNIHLIGQQNKGWTLDELILVPSDPVLAASFKQRYLESLNAEVAFEPFIGADVDVVAVFEKKRITAQGYFFNTDIHNLAGEMAVETE